MEGEFFQEAVIEAEDLWLMQMAAMDENDDIFVGVEEEHFSFEDSERFEEDSLCSLASETGSLNHKWRGWNTKSQNFHSLLSTDIPCTSKIVFTNDGEKSFATGDNFQNSLNLMNTQNLISNELENINVGSVTSLVHITSKQVAQTLSFETLEYVYQTLHPNKHLPDNIFITILQHCFPEFEEDIRLYSCLANGNANQFLEGERLYQGNAVREIFQIGYHISATVNKYEDGNVLNTGFLYDVSIRVDRCRIVFCTCSCSSTMSWCQHVVAVCLKRIRNKDLVKFRSTIWDSITELSDDRLKKLTQYLINELPREYLPVAQKLIDQLRDPSSEINLAIGAPDPTAGGHDEMAIWCMDENVLHDNIRKILISFVKPSPAVHCDVQFLSTSSPPSSNDFNILMRPHQYNEPEALWNLLSIVMEMFKRGDDNATTLLHVITENCLKMDQVLIWWYQTCLTQSGHWHTANYKNLTVNSQMLTTQYNAASLCQEIVRLWRLAALNPKLSEHERDQFASLFQLYHRTAVHRVAKISENYYQSLNIVNSKNCKLSSETLCFSKKHFPGFFAALQVCYLDWHGHEISRLTNELNFSNIHNILQKQKISSNSELTVMDCLNIPIFRNGQIDPNSMDILFSKQSVETQQQQQQIHPNNRQQFVATMYNSTYTYPYSYPTSSRQRINNKNSVRTRRTRRPIARNNGLGNRAGPSNSRNERTTQRIKANKNGQQLRNGAEGLIRPNIPSSSNDLNQPLEEISDDSTTDGGVESDQKVVKENFRSKESKSRKSYTDELDALFALAHCELNTFTIRFAFCEALNTHGYAKQALQLAYELASEFLHSPPNTLLTFPHLEKRELSEELGFEEEEDYENISNCSAAPTRNNKKQLNQNSNSNNSKCHKISELVATTLWRTIYLIKILTSTETISSQLNSFVLELALRILRNPRGPASTRWLEVYIHSLEEQLFNLIKTNEIRENELKMIREFAESYLNEIKFTPLNRIIVPPTIMAHFIYDSLTGTSNLYTYNNASGEINMRSSVAGSTLSKLHSVENLSANLRTPSDEQLGLNVALETLGMRVFISESDHPMLCEGIRRQRGDLARKLLIKNRDSLEKLGRILEKVLDSEIHRMYGNHESNAAFFFGYADFKSSKINRSDVKEQDNLIKNEANKPNNHLIRGAWDSSPKSKRNLNVSLDEKNKTLFNKLEKMSLEEKDESAIISIGNRDDDSQISSARLSESTSSEDAIYFSGKKTPLLLQISDIIPNRRNTLNFGSKTLNNADFNCQKFYCNQASEAQAHYMFEFAKKLLIEAGGNAGGVMFNTIHHTAGVSSQDAAVGAAALGANGGANRNLHICSFLVGLYALGLNNIVSSTWPTRTYSAHVSWIHTQALEIGRNALEIVRHTWEKHLTPTEVASLADKASQRGDQALVREAALLALSVLPKAYALTAVESQKALNQCKEQSSKLLSEACLAVEKAAEKDGVYPEVLFKVARHWYSLYLEVKAKQPSDISNRQGHAQIQHYNFPHYPPPNCMIMMQPPPPPPLPPPPPPHQIQCNTHSSPFYPLNEVYQPNQMSNSLSPRLHVSHSAPDLPQHQFQQQPYPLVHHCNQNSGVYNYLAQQQPSLMFAVPPTTTTYNYVTQMSQPPNVSIMARHNSSIYSHPPPLIQQSQQQYSTVNQHQSHRHSQPQLPPSHLNHAPFYTLSHLPQHIGQQQQQLPPPIVMGEYLEPAKTFLINAHKVGIRAMDTITLSLRNAEDHRTYVKYSKNSSFCDDIRWLFEEVCVLLDQAYVHTFCEKATACVVSPFLLLQLIKECAKYYQLQILPPANYQNFHISLANLPGSVPVVLPSMTKNGSSLNENPNADSKTTSNCGPTDMGIKLNLIAAQAKTLMLQYHFPYSIAELLRHCVEICYVASHHKLSYARFGDQDIEEICELILVAREAFLMIPEKGRKMFDDFLRFIKKQKASKREVLQKINSSLQKPISN